MLIGTISSRVPQGLSMEGRHASLGNFLSNCRNPWRARQGLPEIRLGVNDVSYASSLGKAAPDGVKMRVCYHVRNEMLWRQDDTLSDDFLTVELAKRIDVKGFVSEFLPGLIVSLGAYSCSFTSKTLSNHLFDNLLSPVTEGDGIEIMNLRRKVYYITLVNYWDEELCSRAWGYGIKEAVERLSKRVDFVRIVNNGILFCVSYTSMSVEDEINAGEMLMDIMGGSGGDGPIVGVQVT